MVRFSRDPTGRPPPLSWKEPVGGHVGARCQWDHDHYSAARTPEKGGVEKRIETRGRRRHDAQSNGPTAGVHGLKGTRTTIRVQQRVSRADRTRSATAGSSSSSIIGKLVFFATGDKSLLASGYSHAINVILLWNLLQTSLNFSSRGALNHRRKWKYLSVLVVALESGKCWQQIQTLAQRTVCSFLSPDGSLI